MVMVVRDTNTQIDERIDGYLDALLHPSGESTARVVDGEDITVALFILREIEKSLRSIEDILDTRG